MASVNEFTVLDGVQRLDPKGRFMSDQINEYLNEINEFKSDMVWKEANHLTSHQYLVRTNLPKVYTGRLNQRTQLSKSEVGRAIENTMILETGARHDVRALKYHKAPMAYRLDEMKTRVESMNIAFHDKIFYGNPNTGDPDDSDDIKGLTQRFNSSTGDTSENIILNDVTGVTTTNKNMSVWYIKHGERAFYGIYPEGTSQGLMFKDFNIYPRQFEDGFQPVYLDMVEMAFGIVPESWRSIGRVCNINREIFNATSTAANTLSGTNSESIGKQLLNNMMRIKIRVDSNPGSMSAKGCWYMNPSCFEALAIVARNMVGDGGGLTYGNYQGKTVREFMGSPIRLVNSLTDSEPRVA